MKVKLLDAWFGPTEVEMLSGERPISGVLYRPGVYDFPDDWKKLLPKSATVLTEKEAKAVAKTSEPVKKDASLKDFDEDRMNSDAYEALMNKTHKEQKKG